MRYFAQYKYMPYDSLLAMSCDADAMMLMICHAATLCDDECAQGYAERALRAEARCRRDADMLPAMRL